MGDGCLSEGPSLLRLLLLTVGGREKRREGKEVK